MSEGEQTEGLFWIEEIDTRASSFFPEDLGANNSVSGLILSNNLLYNLHSFSWELVYVGKFSLSNIICVEHKMIFHCV